GGRSEKEKGSQASGLVDAGGSGSAGFPHEGIGKVDELLARHHPARVVVDEAPDQSEKGLVPQAPVQHAKERTGGTPWHRGARHWSPPPACGDTRGHRIPGGRSAARRRG